MAQKPAAGRGIVDSRANVSAGVFAFSMEKIALELSGRFSGGTAEACDFPLDVGKLHNFHQPCLGTGRGSDLLTWNENSSDEPALHSSRKRMYSRLPSAKQALCCDWSTTPINQPER